MAETRALNVSDNAVQSESSPSFALSLSLSFIFSHPPLLHSFSFIHCHRSFSSRSQTCLLYVIFSFSILTFLVWQYNGWWKGETHKHRTGLTVMMAKIRQQKKKKNTGDVIMFQWDFINFLSFFIFLFCCLSQISYHFVCFLGNLLYMFYRSLSCQIKCKPKEQEVLVLIVCVSDEGLLTSAANGKHSFTGGSAEYNTWYNLCFIINDELLHNSLKLHEWMLMLLVSHIKFKIGTALWWCCYYFIY